MAHIGRTDRYGVQRAVRMRRRNYPTRVVGTAALAAGLHFVFGWWAVWAWWAVYLAVQSAEFVISDWVTRRMPDTAAGAMQASLILFVPSAAVLPALAPALWMGVPDYGPVMAVTLISASMMNLIALSRGSRITFTVSCAPYGLYLLALPLLEAGKTTAPLFIAILIAVAMVLLNTLGAWSMTEEALRAEEDALAEAETRRRQAEEAVEAKSAFVAMISHELRTPISAILAGAAQLERSSDGACAREQGLMIGDAGRMMSALLNDLLDLSRLEAGRMGVEQIPYDLRRTVLDAIRMWRPQASEKGLRLRVDGAAALPHWVRGDPTRLRQVLNNLLSNAIKFTEEGAVTLRIDNAVGAAGRRRVTLAVIDTGPGIAAEQIERLFTPFDQLDTGTARKYGGSGLGLVISRELARLMEGDLTVTSEAGRGATFTLTLDLDVVDQPASEQAPTAVQARVLVVDDHAINRQAVSLVLAPLGVAAETAASAEEALERLRNETFDVVLMDVYMPDMDGREATRRLRATPGPNQHAPVIAITASATPKDWEACQDAGMNAYVGKPIEPAQLYSVLERVLAGDLSEAA